MEYNDIIYKTSVFIDSGTGFVSIKKYRARKTKTGYTTNMILHKRVLFSDINIIKKDIIKDTFTSLRRYAFTLCEEDARKITLELMNDLASLTEEVSKNMNAMSQRLKKKIDLKDLTVEDLDPITDYSKFRFTEDML